MPRSHRAAMPPVSASGTALNTKSASRGEPRAEYSNRKIRKKQTGTTMGQALARRGEVLKLTAPTYAIARRQLHLFRDLSLSLLHERADVAPAHVRGHHDTALPVLSADLVSVPR